MSKIKVPGYSFPHFSHSSWLSNGHLLKAPSSGPHLILITTTPTPPLPSTITWDGGWLEHQCMNLVWDTHYPFTFYAVERRLGEIGFLLSKYELPRYNLFGEVQKDFPQRNDDWARIWEINRGQPKRAFKAPGSVCRYSIAGSKCDRFKAWRRSL